MKNTPHHTFRAPGGIRFGFYRKLKRKIEKVAASCFVNKKTRASESEIIVPLTGSGPQVEMK